VRPGLRARCGPRGVSALRAQQLFRVRGHQRVPRVRIAELASADRRGSVGTQVRDHSVGLFLAMKLASYNLSHKAWHGTERRTVRNITEGQPPNRAGTRAHAYSMRYRLPRGPRDLSQRTTFTSELWTFNSPLHPVNPSLAELVREEVHALSGGANHLGQRFLNDLGDRHRFIFGRDGRARAAREFAPRVSRSN
jgi:hypothetical protein